MVSALKFEWSAKKAEANSKKHKVRFEKARELWKDFSALDLADDRKDYGEDRFNRIGMVAGRLLVVTYTTRFDNGDEIIRIISARPAEPRERRRYHEA